MNHNIITTSSMIQNRDNQSIKGCHPSVETHNNHIVRTLQVLLTALTMLFAVGVQGAWSADVASRTINGNVSTWTFTGTPTTGTTMSDGNIDCGILYKNNSAKNSLKGYLSSTAGAQVYIPVPAGGAGTITMVVNSSSDSRYYQLYISDTESNVVSQRMYSKKSSDNNVSADGKTGPQSFTFTSSDLTTVEGQTYLKLQAVGGEMKVNSFTVTLTSGMYGAVKQVVSVLGTDVKINGISQNATFVSNEYVNTKAYAYAPTCTIVKTTTYDDESKETEDVIVTLSKNGENTHFIGTAVINDVTYTVKIPVKEIATLQPIDASTTWSFNGANTSDVSIKDGSNYIVYANEDGWASGFNANALSGYGSYLFYKKNGCANVYGLKFRPTVAGKVTVTFANTGSSNPARTVIINGTIAHETGATGSSDVTTNEIEVAANQDVTILGIQVSDEAAKEVSVKSVVFTASSSPDPVVIPTFSLTEEQNVIDTQTPADWSGHKVQLPQIPEITESNATVVSGLVAEADNTAAIQKALNNVPAEGGMVIIPEGEWLSGPLTIKSKTVLHLCTNTTLKMLPYGTYPEEKDKCLITTAATVGSSDVVIEGEGYTSIIDGQGADWWNALESNSSLVRPSGLIRFNKGARYLVRNLVLQNAPNTNLQLGNSGNASHFTVHDVKIVNPASEDAEATADGFSCNSHNTDGIPVWGPYCNIYKCNISTGDDNVVFDSDSQYGHVWDCDFGRGHGASIGSYTVNVHDILWDNIRFNGTESGFKVKSQRGRSGDVYNITAQNSTMTKVRDILYLDCWYDQSTKPTPGAELEAAAPAKTETTPAFRDITFKNITATDCVYKSSAKNGFPIYFYGLPESHIKNVTLYNVNIEGQKGMFMAYVGENEAEGVTFQNGCNITNVREPSAAAFVTEYNAVHNDDYVTAAEPKSSEKQLLQAKFSNGFDAFINESSHTVTAYYMQDEAAPTLVTKDQSAKATTTIDGTTITVTAEDGTTQDYALTLTAVAPYTTTGERQFDGTETWIKTGGAYTTEASSKTYYAWVINKNAADGRKQLGKTRIYFFVGNSDKVTLINDRGTSLSSDRAIKVYVNGEEKSTPTSMPKYNSETPASIDIATGGPAMIEIAANQTSGDTGWGKIVVTPKSAGPELEEKALFSWDGSGKSGAPTATGGTLSISGTVTQETQKGNFVNKFANGWTVGTNSNYVKIALTEGLKAGDIIHIGAFITTSDNAKYGGINVYGYSSDDDAQIANHKLGTTENVEVLTSNGTPTDQTMIVTDAWEGFKYIVLSRNGNTGTFLSKVTITGLREVTPGPEPDPTPSYPTTATWDFTSGTSACTQAGQSAANYPSDVDGIALAVTYSDGGQLKPRAPGNADAQINAITTIKIPVTSVYDEITVTNYNNDEYVMTYSMGGESGIKDQERFFKPSAADVTAGFMTLTVTGNGYFKKIKVIQQGPGYVPTENWDPTWDDVNNRYVVKTSNNADAAIKATENAKGLTEALKYIASKTNKTLFIPNGTYDLGTKAQTAVPTGATLKGESMEGVIIKNNPEYEGIGITATLQIDGNDVTLEDLTLYCRAPYGTTLKDGNPTSSSAERGVCLVDRGTNNVFRHITLDGLQDTYYSWKSNDANTSYFYDCVLKGSVDFLCGSGNVWFENCTLGVVPGHSDNNGTLSKNAPYIIAPNADDPEFGYIFNNCTIVNGSSVNMDGNYYLGRPWNGKPKASFINTTMNILPKAEGFSIQSAGTGGYIASVWTEIGSVDGLGNPVNTNSRMSDVTVISKTKPEAKKLPAPEVTKSGSKITWTAVDGAIAYNVYKDGVFQAKIDVQTSSAARGMFRSAANGALEYDITGAEDATWTVRAINALRVIGLAQNEQPEAEDPYADIPFTDEALVINSTNKPFAYATATDRTSTASVKASNITGGGEYDLETIMEKMGKEGVDYTVGTAKEISTNNGTKKAIVLQSDNTVDSETKKETRVPMDAAIYNAIKANDIIVLDGSGTSTDFVVSKYIRLSNVNSKTIVGINGARLCTEWYLTDYFKSLLENVPTSSGTGVNTASTAEGTGGSIYVINNKGVEGFEPIKEEGEYLTRKTLLEATGDKTEHYRNAGIFYIDHSSNLIIRNFKFVGPGSLDCAGYDLMAIIDGTDHCWVDHCEFVDGMDGNFDITNESDFITVSWCKFYYTDRSYAHQNTNLVGSSDEKFGDRGKLNITFAYNEWGANCRARMPMARFGRIHMLNNYYNCAGNSEYAMNPRKESQFLIEGNYWEKGVRRAYNPKDEDAITWGTNNYYADSAAGNAGASKGSTVTVPYQYSSLMLDPMKVPEVVGLNGGAKLYQKPYFTTNLGVADNTPDTQEFQHNATLSESLKTDGLVFSVWAEYAHTFQWYKQDIDLDGNTGDWTMLENENRNTYTFKPVTGVEFNLKCQAFGISGETTSDILKVKIDGLAAPYYLGGMPTEMQTVYTGSPMTFTANFKDAQGYQWYKNTTNEIVVDDAHKIEGATFNTYTYDPTTAEIFYLYCVASNSNGKGDGYSDVVKVKGIHRDIKFHYYGNYNYTAGKSEEVVEGGEGGLYPSDPSKSTFHTDCTTETNKCTASLNSIGTDALHDKISGLRFENKDTHTTETFFAENTYVEFTLENALVAGQAVRLGGFTGKTDSPDEKFGFYVCTSATKTSDNTVATLKLTQKKNTLEYAEATVPASCAGAEKLYVIPFVDKAGRDITLHELMVYDGETVPADDPTVTVDTESPVSAKVGSEVVVRITATDAESYQWYKNSTEELVFDEEHKIEGQTNANLSYTPAAEGTEYVYCRVIGKKVGTHVDTPIIQLNISEASASQSGDITVTWPLVDGSNKYTAAPTATITGDITVENEVLVSKSDVLLGSKLTTDSKTMAAQFTDDKTTHFYAIYKPTTSDNLTSDNLVVDENAYVKFTFTPKVSFKPTKVSFLATINGTGNGGFQPVLVYGSGTEEKVELTVPTLFKRDTGIASTGTKYECPLSDLTISPSTPVTLYLYVGGKITSSRNVLFKDVKIEGKYIKEELTQCLTPTIEKGNWDAEHQQWEYTLACAQPETAKIHYKIGDADAVEAPTNPVTIKVSEDEAFSVWASDPETDPEAKLKDSKTVEMTGAARPQLAAPSILFNTYKVDVPANRGFLVTLTDNNEGVENVVIHYTIDGSEPTTESAAYTVPFLVGGDVTVKAIATKTNYASSKEESAKTLPVNSEGSETTTNKNTNNHYSTVGENVGFAYTYNDNNKTVQNANKLSDGLKFTTNANLSIDGKKGFAIKVNPGFVITKVVATKATTNNDAGTMTFGDVYVDGEKSGTLDKKLPYYGSSNDANAITFTVAENIAAKEKIEVEVNSDGVKNNQANVLFTVFYEFDDAPAGVTITDSKDDTDVITLEGDDLAAFKTDHTYTVDVNKEYAEDPIVKITTEKGYEYIVPAGDIETTGDELTHFDKRFVGVTYTVKAKVNAVKSPNIEIGENMSLKGGYKVTLKYSEDQKVRTAPYIKIGDGEWEQYNPEKEYYTLSTVQSKMKYGENLESETVAREASCPSNSYTAGKPFAVYLYVNGYQDNQTGANIYNDQSFGKAEDKIYSAIANQFNVIPLAVNNSDAILEKRPDITDAKLVVITETLGGSGSVEIAGVGNKSNMMALTLKRDVLDKTNVLNLKMFLNSSSSANNQRWQWAQPRAMASELTSIMPCTPDGGGMYEIFGNATMSRDASINLWDDISTENMLYHLQPVFNFNEDNETRPIFTPLALVIDPEEPEDQREEYHAIHTYKNGDYQYIGFGLSINEWKQYNDNVYAIIDKIGEMIKAGKDLDSKLTGIVKPTVTDNGDGSANVYNNNPNADTYYKVYTEAEYEALNGVVPTAESVISNGVKANDTDFHTQKYIEKMHIFAVSKLGSDATSAVVEGTVEGNSIRYVIRENDDPAAQGLVAKYPFDLTVNNGTFNMPYNQSWKKDGYTVIEWEVTSETSGASTSSGTSLTRGSRIKPGESVSGLTQDITVKAIWTENTHKITDLSTAENKAQRTVTWEFRQSKGAPALAMESKAGNMQAILVGQAKFSDDTFIDVPMTINTDNLATLPDNGTEYHGKFNNTSTNWAKTLADTEYTGSDYAQVRTGAQFTFPAVYGMNVVYKQVDLVEAVNGVANGNVNRSQVSQSFLNDGTKTADVLKKWNFVNPGFQLDANGKVVMVDGKAQLANTSAMYAAYGEKGRELGLYDEVNGGNDKSGGLIYYQGEATEATLTSMESAQYIHVGATTGKPLGGLNYGSVFMESLSVVYPELYDLDYNVVAVGNTGDDDTKSEYDANDELAKVEFFSNTHKNADGRYFLGDKVKMKFTPAYGYEVLAEDVVPSDPSDPSYIFIKNGAEAFAQDGMTVSRYLALDADGKTANDAKEITAEDRIPVDGAIVDFKMTDLNLTFSIKKLPAVKYNVEASPATMGYITFNSGTGRPHKDEYEEFPVGKTIYVTAHPNTGYKFKEWRRNSDSGEIILSSEEWSAKPEEERTGFMEVPDGVTKGDGIMVNPFDKSDKLEKDEMMFTVSEDNNNFTYVAIFEEGKTGIAYYEFDHALLKTSAGQKHNDMTPLTITAEDKNKFPKWAESKALNIPEYYTLFKPGYTLDHWVEINGTETGTKDENVFTPTEADGKFVYADNEKEYRIGTFYYYETENEVKHLVPVFTKNSTSYDYRATPVDITWDLRLAENAQRVDFRSGVGGTTATTKIYYSTHATINNNVLIDVPLTITLGKKGKLVNDIEEEDKWCAMGEGTTIEIPSGLGAKFTIATLSKMETTTIDGVVPTSYTVEKIDDADVYLYTFTTDSKATSVTLKIGDDYTYYKYIRAELPAADAVPLTVTVNNDAFGTVEIAKVRTTADTEDNTPLLDKIKDTRVSLPTGEGQGGASYTLGLGTIVSLHAKRSHLYVLDYFEDGEGNRYSFKAGSLCVTDKDGKDITDAATAQDEYLKMEKVQDFNTMMSLNDILLTFQVQSYSESMHAVYKENTLYQVNYTSGEEAEGEAPGMMLVEDGESFTIPAENHHLYVDGQTLRYWIDEDGNKYDLGQTYTLGQTFTASKALPSGIASGKGFSVPKKDIFLTPVFKVNEFTVLNLTAAATASWPLSRKGSASYPGNGDIVINYEGINGIYVTPLKLSNGDFIDLKMDIRGENGKANNVNSTDRCQINSGTVFGLPSSSNCSFTLKSANNEIKVKVDGGSDITGNPTVSSDYTGDKTQIDVNFTGNTYLYEVVAEYKPVSTELPELDYATVGNISLGALGTPLAGFKLSTLKSACEVSGVPADLSNSTTGIMPVVKGTATRGGYVEVIQATIDNPVATMLVKTRDGVTVSVYKIGFDVIYPNTAPRVTDLKIDRKHQCDLKKMYDNAIKDTRVDGTNYINDVAYLKHLGVDGSNAANERVGVNGVINIRFSTKMAETTIGAATLQAQNGKATLGQAVSALEGQTLTFTYKGLAVNTEYDFIIPAGTFKDVFYAESTTDEQREAHTYNADIRLHFTTVETAISTDRRVVNYVVTHNQASHFDAEQAKMVADGDAVQVASDELIANLDAAGIAHGTLDDGVKLANAYNEAGKRFYIFVPDGEYQLMGNEAIKSLSSAPIGEDGKGISALNGKENVYNGITTVSKDNVSITGQSQDKTIVYNHPAFEGLSYASTLKLNGGIANFYAQDMTLQNRFNFLNCRKVYSKGVAPALWDRSTKPIFKNVKFDSYQDTYYTNANSQLDDTRGYIEDCTIMGYVDFICGDGDHWFQNCDMVVRQGVGSTATNMFAARQYDTQKWGYVMNQCTFSAENKSAFDVNNGKMTISRPWANSPAETLIECKYDVLSTDDGYKKMNDGGLVLRMQEYKSYNADGTILDLSKRSLRNSSPAIGSYDAVMTPAKAAEYNLFNVMGGEDGYDPTLFTAQVNMTNTDGIKQDDTFLTWDDKKEALCYFVFMSDTEDGEYKLFAVTDKTEFEMGNAQIDKWFYVRAANQRGGLGAPTNAFQYKAHESYKRELVNNNQVIDGWRWSTIYLDFNAQAPVVQHEKVENGTPVLDTNGDPVMEDEIYVYALVKVDATKLTFKRVKTMEKNCGYLIKARPRAEEYEFKYTEKTPVYYNGMTVPEYRAAQGLSAEDFPHMSLMNGSVTDKAAAGTAGYTLANKTSYGLGFYKYVGKQYNANFAWLDASLVAEAQKAMADGSLDAPAKAGYMMMIFDDDFIEDDDDNNVSTELNGVTDLDTADGYIYNLSGQRINPSQMQRGQIYIINGKKIRF